MIVAKIWGFLRSVFNTSQIVDVKRRLTIAIAIVLILGLLFRTYHIGYKTYWHDEVFTTVRVVGYTGPELEKDLLGKSAAAMTVTAADLQAYQSLPQTKTWGDTLASLKTHPEHPPLFYLLERFWISLFGTSVFALRSLSVLFGCLMLPLMYQLCWTLFQDRWIGLVAVALLAVSPVQVLYSQEAREYSLWGCLILLSSIALLQAMALTGRDAIKREQLTASRRNSIGIWLFYAFTVALSFYTTVLSVFPLIAQGLFVLVSGSQRHWRRFILAMILAIAGFSPWLWVMVNQSQKLESVTRWTTYNQPLGSLMRFWGLHLSSTFIDFGLPLAHPYTYIVPPLILVLVAIAAVQFTTETVPRNIAFCFLLLLVPCLGLILPDLIQGGQRSTATRYFMPTLLAVTMIVAVWLQSLLLSRRLILRRWGQGLFAMLLVVGLWSCGLSAQSDTWWNKGVSYHVPRIAEVINSADRPLVLVALASNGLGNAISLSYQVDADTPFMLFRRKALPPLPLSPEDNRFSRYFVPYASQDLIDTLESNTNRQVLPVETPGVYELWELK